ncbi:MAG: aminotransferase class I/II-fold pyridoxal phosphate-dependent enzyme [Limisphaerales bacterium]
MKAASAVDSSSVPSRHRQYSPYEVSLATAEDREAIYRLRHEVYSRELGQHPDNAEERLCDEIDEWNAYLVVKAGETMAGFVSITPPSAPRFSIDKYFPRNELPVQAGEAVYEVRLLTVIDSCRGTELAGLLMYAALRWVEADGGNRIIGIGRREIMRLYQRCGMRATGRTTTSGRVCYELMHASVEELRRHTQEFGGLLTRMEEQIRWRLPMGFRQPARCFHGGAFFKSIGEDFSDLERRHDVINADVLDAWFPPAPAVTEVLTANLDWLLRTSPPTDCAGLIRAIAEARGVQPANILPGAGSSDLIFRALRHWLRPESHVLILDPTYGEYAHVLEKVIGCTVDRLTLSAEDDYEVNLDRLRVALRDAYDLVVLVNPNSPTGRHVPRRELLSALRSAPSTTRIWIDETYVEYAGEGESLESIAAASVNVIVCKSMSKVYALSGARVAYLCSAAHQLEGLRAITPPWVVGLPSQVAAVKALASPDHYRARYRETHELRASMANGLKSLGWRIVPGIANFLLCELPKKGPKADMVVQASRQHGLFLRNVSTMGTAMEDRMIRLAVKDAATNRRMLEILTEVCR